MNAKQQAQLQKAQEQQQKAQQQEAKRKMILKQIMSSEAYERLNRIALVKPEKAHQVGNMLMQAVQSRSVQGLIDDNYLKNMLNKIGEQQGNGPKITVRRKRDMFEDSDDSDDGLDLDDLM